MKLKEKLTLTVKNALLSYQQKRNKMIADIQKLVETIDCDTNLAEVIYNKLEELKGY